MTNRLKKARDELQKNSLDALLISSVPNIIYLTGYAGFSQIEREAYMLITNKNLYLFTDGRYTQAVKNISHLIFKEISPLLPLLKTIETICSEEKIAVIGFEEENLSVSEHKHFKKIFPKLKGITLSPFRQEKDKNEIAAIRKACTLGDKAFAHVLTKIKSGVTEKELAFEIEFFIKKHGGALSFPTIVAFGKNSAIPHHLTSDQRLATRDIILLDFGVLIDNYCSDMTRTVFFGKATEEQKKVYQAVYDAQQKSIELLNNLPAMLRKALQAGRTIKQYNTGIQASSIDLAARDHIISQGFPTIPHSIGHGIGIEVHETPTLSPKSKDILSPGMAFSIEPGVYLPGKFGVRIEDLVTIEKDKSLLLTNAPKTLIEL